MLYSNVYAKHSPIIFNDIQKKNVLIDFPELIQFTERILKGITIIYFYTVGKSIYALMVTQMH